MTEYYTGSRTKFTYAIEVTYGTQITSPTGYLGLFRSENPADAFNWHEHVQVDTTTKDLGALQKLSERYQNTFRFYPQHGVFGYLAYGTDEYVAGTPSVHGLLDVIAEDFDLPAFTAETSTVHTTAGSGHTNWYDGCKVNSLELSFTQPNLVEFSIACEAQDSGSNNDSGNTYNSTDLNLKEYTVASKAPFSFSHVYAEIQGTQISPISGRLTLTNDLLADYLCDATVGQKISEPVPQRRRHELELTARMNTDDYYDLFKAGAVLTDVTGNLNEAAGITNSVTTFEVDNGSGAKITNLPNIGVIKIGTEYMHYYDVTNNANDQTLLVTRGCYGSTAATAVDNAAVTCYGAVTLLLNKGTDALGSIDFDGDEDYMCFTLVAPTFRTFSAPRDVEKGILEQTFLIQPLKVIPTVVDNIAVDYATAAS